MKDNFEEITKRAFEIWERDGKPEGRDQEHWFQAEADLRQASGKGKKKSVRKKAKV